MNLRCPVCRRTSWLTESGLAEHMANEHSSRALAEELAKLIVTKETATPVRLPRDPETAHRCGKVGYPDEHTARTELVGTVVSRNRGKNQRRECRVYQCPLCDQWHLTSKPIALMRGTG